MKIACALLFLGLAGAAQCATREYFLEHDGLKRRYVVYVPADKEASAAPLPVVLNFHGGGGHAEGQARTSGMNRVVDRHGFIVVYPDGTSGGEPGPAVLNLGPLVKSVDAAELMWRFFAAGR